jgi:hypothetical protein
MGPGSEPDVPLPDEKNTYASVLEVPPGAVVQHSVHVIAYFDEGGQTKYGFALRGEATVSSAIGLLEIVKQHMLSGMDFSE